MKNILFYILIAFNFNCMSWGNFKTIDLNQSVVNKEDTLVEGRSCHFFGIPFFPALDWAIEDALSKVQNKKGLKNPVFTDEFFVFIRCISVKGYATESEIR